MRVHLSITPSGEFDEVLAQILMRARQDHRIIHQSAAGTDQVLVFCDAPELTKRLSQQLAIGEPVNSAFAVLEISPEFGVIRVNQECSESSRLLLVHFVKWILITFAPCRVFDEETDEDISAIASLNPSELFDED